jgi:quercetin dioxygenase-like cupin family protein
MKVIQLERAESYEPEPHWKRACLCDEPNISIEHFVKPARHASPMHEHPQEQVTLVLEGRMKVVSERDGEAVIGPGDTAFFGGGERHQIINDLDEPSVGVDIFCPRRSFDFWRKRLA